MKYTIRVRGVSCRAEEHDSCSVGPYGGLMVLCFCECHDVVLGDFEERNAAAMKSARRLEEQSAMFAQQRP